MLAFLLSAVLFTLLVALACLVLAALTVVPFVIAVGMAERRGFSPTRWGAVALASGAAGLVGAYALHRLGAPSVLSALPVLLTWAAPAGLWLLDGTEQAIGGRRGLHE